MNATIESIVELLCKRGEYLRGCDHSEVKKIEERLNVQLPEAYKDFLFEMGKEAGNFMRGSSCFYKDLLSIQVSAIELLEENTFQALPDRTFVFWMHQGYQFAFFFLGQNDDPAVYYFTEINKNEFSNDFTPIAESFSSFLYNQLNEEFYE